MLDKYKESGVGLCDNNFDMYFVATMGYSLLFSLFYIVKHLEIINYNNKFDPVIAVAIIIFVILNLLASIKIIDHFDLKNKV